MEPSGGTAHEERPPQETAFDKRSRAEVTHTGVWACVFSDIRAVRERAEEKKS